MSIDVHALAHRLIAAALAVSLGAVAVAGDLNPPAGPVAPTMKTLDQVEPRTPVQSLPGSLNAFRVISEPGSYYLTGDVLGNGTRHGVQITASNVTLDLNGFSIRNTGGTAERSGVHMPSFQTNVVIKNGNISGWVGSGIDAQIDIGRIERITASGNGQWGISNATAAAFSTHIVSCEAYSNGAGGIRGAATSVITDCVARSNSGPGIQAGAGSVISGSTSTNNTSGGAGFVLASGNAMIVNCSARSNNGGGFVLNSGSMLHDSHATGNTGPGIHANNACVIVNNTSNSNVGSNGYGILVEGNDNRVDGNNVMLNGAVGVRLVGSRSLIVRNFARGNTGGNYNSQGENQWGVLWSGADNAIDHPWANFSR
ncbi:MAG: right-handed parallel beta-helix repeat-containing protein [Phycisphaerales bacterium]|nr:MAG: right-handed parallel beta-helix repeat-containing protein [Phycisphaerales bacterium]